MFNKVFKKLGYKKLKINGIKLVVKKLDPTDFLDKNGVPFNIFYVDDPATSFGKLWGKVKTDEEQKKEDNEQLSVLKQVLEKAIIRLPKDVELDDLFQPALLETAMLIYMHVLKMCMSAFIRLHCVNKDQVLFWDTMAKRYGQLPIDCLIPSGKYSAIDSYLFNSFVLSYGIQKENEIIKKRNAKIKKDNARIKAKRGY